jgi:hypothetical protein
MTYGSDDELRPEQTSDDTDRGWGEGAGDAQGGAEESADDDERLRREVPPHHGG